MPASLLRKLLNRIGQRNGKKIGEIRLITTETRPISNISFFGVTFDVFSMTV